MKRTLGWVITCLIALPIYALAQGAGKAEPVLSPSERMDKLFDFWNRLDQPGFAVVVVKDGQVAYQKVFGLACQEHGVAITPNSVFNTATLAETFVGQAVALLEKQGKLSLDDDVRKFLPDIPDFGKPVQLRHLLFQTSGLRDWWSVVQLAGRDREEITFESVLKIVQAQKKLIFTPGDRFQSSNTNYDLLAGVVARATGKPFVDWAWENVFKPLKMTRTQYRSNYRSILDDQAFTYNFTRNEYLRGIDTLSLVGSHSLFTSIADLAKWLVNVETGGAEAQEVYAKMFTAGMLANNRPSPFGYGVAVSQFAGKRRVVQTGTWAGSGAYLAYFPDQKFGFVVLANWDYTPVEGEFAREIVNIYLPSPAPPPPPEKKNSPPAAKKAVKVRPEKLEPYVGDYRLGPGQVFSISRAGDQLYLSVPGQRFALAALSETEFLFDLAGARITFQTNKEGKVNQFLWEQGGNEILAPRVILPTPEELKEFAGSYSNDELNIRFYIELRAGALMAIIPGQGDIRLVPEDKDRFMTGSRFMPTIVFQRDGQNRVTGFIINADPVRDLLFKKD